MPSMSWHEAGWLQVSTLGGVTWEKFKVAEQLCHSISDHYYCIQQILIISTLKWSYIFVVLDFL